MRMGQGVRTGVGYGGITGQNFLVRSETHFGDLCKQCRQNVASDLGLHCLPTEFSVQNTIKLKKFTRNPLNYN